MSRWLITLVLLVGLSAAPLWVHAQRPHKQQSAEAQARKFARVERFATRYRSFQKDVARKLERPALTREVALAAIATIMDRTSMRVGSECYARRGKPGRKRSFGASSLRKRHVRVEGDTVHFAFRGKSSVFWNRQIRDPALARTVRLFMALPGERLWQVPGSSGRLSQVTEAHVQSLFRRYGAKPKDLRTKLANDRYLAEVSKLGPPRSREHAARNQRQAIKKTAKFMGHQPSTCRASYLNPELLARYAVGLE
jgi:DNA topoisomerase-1